MDLKQYIFPIYSGGTIVGQGFIADGYFITAAHVVKDFPSCFIRINSKRFELSDTFMRSSFFNKSDAYDKIIKEDFYHNPLSKLKYIVIGVGNIYHDSSMMDIAMYPCNDIESPLRLSQHIPQKGDQLISYCMHEEMDFSQLNPPCKLKTVPALALGQEEGNYFYCDCEQFAGSSGSPLLKGNEVVGIMHGGNDKGLCAFLKVQVVRNIISQMELSLDYDSCDLDNAIEYKECKYSRDKKRLLKGSGDTIQQGTIVICNEAFFYDDYRKPYGTASGNIIIPKSVKKIGEKAFAWSDELESIEIPDSVIQIGKDAFECCHFLKKVILSNNITEITETMFSYCQSLSEIIIPNSVTKIGTEAFESCDSLTNLIIPSSVECVESLAFWECKSLERVIFLGLVSEIEDNVFDQCDALSEIIVPAGTIDIYKELLSDYEELLIEDKYVKDGNPNLDWTPVGDAYTLEEICDIGALGFAYKDIDGEDAEIIETEFSDGSTALRISVPLKNGKTMELKATKNIQNGFDEGDKIKVSLIYGQELHKIEQDNIVRYDVWQSDEQKNRYLRKRDGEDLNTEVTKDDLANAWTDEFGVKYSADMRRLLKAANNLKDYSIKSGTIIICDNAFSQCKELQTVQIPNSVTAIGDFAFYNCERLSSAILPKSVTNIGMSIFEGCERMPHYHPFE